MCQVRLKKKEVNSLNDATECYDPETLECPRSQSTLEDSESFWYD